MPRCVPVTGSDNRLDCREAFYHPINALPPRCPDCGFPNLAHVPQPYLLRRGPARTPDELAPAQNGCLLVRERLRRVLEAVAPGAFDFFPTHLRDAPGEQTPWSLAVPTHEVKTDEVKPSIPRCSTCGEPRSAHPGTQWVGRGAFVIPSEFDAFRSATWGSDESGWDRWIDRDLYLSARLLALLKAIGAKGILAVGGTAPKPERTETAWVKDMAARLESLGIPLLAPGTASPEDLKWLRAYLKERPARPGPAPEVKAVEKRLKLKLPKSYVEFVTKVGPTTFEDVDGEPGFVARVLDPDALDATGFRVGVADTRDDESAEVDGVIFAATDHGDAFCFDVRERAAEYPVVLHRHELGCFEPFAPNFAACVRRFVER